MLIFFRHNNEVIITIIASRAATRVISIPKGLKWEDTTSPLKSESKDKDLLIKQSILKLRLLEKKSNDSKSVNNYRTFINKVDSIN